MNKPSYVGFDKKSYSWKADVDYRLNPHLYEIGKGQQGVLTCEPYKSEICQHWRFKTPAMANQSADTILKMFYDYLEEFCVHLQTANDKEEILLKRPWTDEEAGETLFRLKDFEAFLKRNKFFEYKTHKVAQRLRDMGGESRQMKIKGRPVRVWVIPAYRIAEVDMKPPKFQAEQSEAPF